MLISMSTFVRRPRWSLRAILGLPLVLACQSNLTPSATPDLAELFWDLRLNHHAVTLSITAPYDTLSLTAMPRNHARLPLAGLPAPQYTTTDARRVVVAPDGMVMAVSPTTSGSLPMVIATLTAGNLRHSDTAYVKVVANPAPAMLGSVSIGPVPPDSAKRAVNSLYITRYNVLKGEAIFNYHALRVRISDTAGSALDDPLVFLESADTMMASLSGGSTVGIRSKVYDASLPQNVFTTIAFAARRPGVADFYASATAFGVTKVDTVRFQFGWPLAAMIQVYPVPARGPGLFFKEYSDNVSTPGVEVKIGAGGVIGWIARGTTDEAEVVFADTTNVRAVETAAPLLGPWYPVLCDTPHIVGGCSAVGNFVLPPTPSMAVDSESIAYRVFPVPGIYEFSNSQNGASGRVIVVDEN